jgi:hypothetical protein
MPTLGVCPPQKFGEMSLVDFLICPIPLVKRLVPAPEERRNPERPYEFPFILPGEKLVQHPDRRHRVIVYGHDPTHRYPALGEMPIKNRERKSMGSIDEDKIDDVRDVSP